ncbi:MAG: ROK family protein, partial [Mycobacterium sp.]
MARAIDETAPKWLAIDIGGSGIKYAIADESYELTQKGVLPTQYESHASFIDAVGGIYDRFKDTVSGIAMSSCGELDPDTGHMFSGGTLTFNTGTNMIDSVTARCGVPVSIENDANCALLAEAHSGCLTNCRNAVALIIGTAIGGAIMINRDVYRGSHFHAGNASFTKVGLAIQASPQLDTLNGVGALTSRYAEA